MEELFKGVLRFQREGSTARREFFSRLEKGQQPHTLFISCSDSRVVPTLITGADAGDLFLLRNVANIVPPHGERVIDGAAAAAIEYAVEVLQVANIVVCGHSQCGGCAALNQDPAALAYLPSTRRWLELAAAVKPRVAELCTGDDPDELARLTEQVNVLVQLEHLLTYPTVADRVAGGKLNLLGWHYVIGTGDVLNFNQATGQFEKVTE